MIVGTRQHAPRPVSVNTGEFEQPASGMVPFPHWERGNKEEKDMAPVERRRRGRR